MYIRSIHHRGESILLHLFCRLLDQFRRLASILKISKIENWERGKERYRRQTSPMFSTQSFVSQVGLDRTVRRSRSKNKSLISILVRTISVEPKFIKCIIKGSVEVLH